MPVKMCWDSPLTAKSSLTIIFFFCSLSIATKHLLMSITKTAPLSLDEMCNENQYPECNTGKKMVQSCLWF